MHSLYSCCDCVLFYIEMSLLYKPAEEQNLNAWEFDVLKRIVRCRKKGQFLDDLYVKEYQCTTQ